MPIDSEKIMKKCSRFSSCSVNRCPLDVDINLRNELKGEPKCDMAKSIRLRIGMESKLLKLGLTDREFSARQKWESKSDEEKIEIKNRLAKNAFQKQSQNQS
jgi:hypothetical protein